MLDVWHLNSVDWLRELKSRELDRLRGAALFRDYAAGETIFAPEHNPHSLYLLERGLVRIYRLSSEGSETTFGYVSAGEVFGELAAFAEQPRESFAIAVRESRVWKIPHHIFLDIIKLRPGIVLEVTRQIGARLKRIESRVENLVFRDARQRLAHILLELSEDFGAGDPVTIDADITQTELSTLVGSTRQTVNANLRDFESRGLITRRGRRLVLLEIDALEEIARSSQTP